MRHPSPLLGERILRRRPTLLDATVWDWDFAVDAGSSVARRPARWLWLAVGLGLSLAAALPYALLG